MNPRGPLGEFSNDHHILIAILGLSPAVLTETVFALASLPEPDLPDRVIVITTRNGKKCANQTLFDQGAWTGLLNALDELLGPEALKNKLRFGPAGDCIRVVPNHDLSGDLEDIQTSEDNRAVADYLIEQMSTLCGCDHFRVTASIAGGRKTMGALMLSALSIVGRPQDRAMHILVNDPWDRIPEFFYPGCPGRFRCPNTGRTLSSGEAKLSLAEIPFVPLRHLFERELQTSQQDFQRLVHRLIATILAIGVIAYWNPTHLPRMTFGKPLQPSEPS